MRNLIPAYLTKGDWRVKENSNMNYSLQGMNNFISSNASKQYWLEEIYGDETAHAHNDADIHIHDLGMISVYCVGWDLYDLLIQGFTGVTGKAAAGPPKHFDSALSIIVNFMYTLTGESAGAQAFSHFDTLLAPFVRADKLTYKQVKQFMQGFVFNINIATRVGFQTPFTNLTFDLTMNPLWADKRVMVGGKLIQGTYSEYQYEMDMINKAFLEVMLEGDANGRIFTFPIPTYNITEDFDWDNGYMHLLWACTAKYGTPYFSNFINSDMKPEDARSMCCRLRLDNKELNSRGGGLFGANPLTGSIGVVTINMPRIGYRAKTVDEFKHLLNEQLEIAHRSLEIKREILERLTEEGLYPYTKHYLRSIKAQTGAYWTNHFSTIGLVGMNEACLNMGYGDIASSIGRAFTIDTLTQMRDTILGYQKMTGSLYNLEATPAESTGYRFAMADKTMYSDILCANEEEFKEGAHPYYTNSSHLPVEYSDDMVDILNHQDEIQCLYTGGTVVHLFVGEKIDDWKAVRNLVHKICQQYKMPYFTITPTFSICPSHGYKAGEHFNCPDCDAICEVYSRVVGYLRPVEQWNNGKQEEFAKRKTARWNTQNSHFQSEQIRV